MARAWRRRRHNEGWNFGEMYFSVNDNKGDDRLLIVMMKIDVIVFISCCDHSSLEVL